MRSSTGDGYQLTLLESAGGTWYGPGLALVYSGQWQVGPHTLLPGEGAELGETTTVSGEGLIGICEAWDQPIGGGIHKREVVLHDKNWGYEMEVMGDVKLVQLKLLHVRPGHRTSLQRHEHKDELMSHIGCCNTIAWIRPGDEHRVTGPHMYFEASTYHPDDVIRIQDDYGRE